MVITEHKTNMDSDKITSVLKSPTSSHEDRLNMYKTLTNQLRTDEDYVSADFIKNCKSAINLALTDMCDKLSDINQGSLQFLGLCIHNRFIVDTLSPKESESILQGLCKCIMHTDDKAICTRCLWCLSNQTLHVEVLHSQLNNIIDSLNYSFSKPLSQSVLVEHEAVSVVIRLLQQIPKKMQEKAPCWSHQVYGLLGHGAVKVREKSLQALTLALPALLQNPNGLIPTMVADVKTKMTNELKKLFNNRNEVYVLKVWSLLVQLLGKELHCVFINQLLPIVELGFKSSIPNIKYEAFCAWKYLIENFASNPVIIGDQKRIKLLMQVFKINNAKTETVAMKKLEVWWYFVKKLDTKILSNFDMVCTPLLRFCVGGKWTQGSRNTPTPKSVNTPISLPSQGTIWPSFSPLQKKGLEVIAHLLKLPPSNLTLPAVELELDALNDNVVMGPALFLKQSSVIAYATVELMCSVDASDDLVLYIWCLLVEHMRLGLEAGLKVDCRDALSSFLCDFSTLVLSRQAPYSVKYKLFLAVSKLPKKILCSTAYNISSGEKIHGTPALFLTELLLTPSMLEEGITQENYVSLFGNLIEMGMANPSGALEFCQAVIQVLDRHAGFVHHPEPLFKLWFGIASPLLEHISKNNEVNQGDALEHNFTSLYRTLFFPIKWLFGKCLSQTSTKGLLKIWGNMYRTFANLAALVVNASANVTCEHISHLVLEEITDLEKQFEDVVFVECLAQLCEVVLSCVNFSSHGENSPFALCSPGKWGGKRKQKPLKNLHSFVTLLAKVTFACHNLIIMENNNNVGTPEKQSMSSSVQSTVKCVVPVLTTLFSSITTSNHVPPVLEKCAQPISGLFAVSKKPNSKIYPASFLPKIDKLWQDIIYCAQNVYTGMYDSDFLMVMAPLLEINFLHSRRSVKLQTVQFWNATFGQSRSLTYPESLRSVLSKVKEKVLIMLPGWISTEIQIIEETPTSQFSEISSQVADEIPVPIMLSPSKMHGSMLKNVVSNAIAPVNVKPKPMKDSPVGKKLSISDLKDKDFVVINPPQNKCRILTQHQQEVLRERKFSVPAMYNSLDQSQDSLAYSNSINNSQMSSRVNSIETFPEALQNEKSNEENAVRPIKKSNFLDESAKQNSLSSSNPFSKQESSKELALTSQENFSLKPNNPKQILAKVLVQDQSILSGRAKESKNLVTPAAPKNVPDSTPLQNWLSNSKTCELSKNTKSLEPHVSSLIEEDSMLTCDSPIPYKKLTTDANRQKNVTFVEETQSPIKMSPEEKDTTESVLETPVKATPVKEINHDSINTRQLTFDDLEEITSKSSEGPSQVELSPCESTLEPCSSKSANGGMQIILVEEKLSDNLKRDAMSLGDSNVINCQALIEDIEDPLAGLGLVESIPDNPQVGSKPQTDPATKKSSQKRKLSVSPDLATAKRTKLSSDMEDSMEGVKSLNSSDDFLEETLESSLNTSANSSTDDSKLSGSDSHGEKSPPRKHLVGSRKRKPLKVTKLIPTSPGRRISPVKTRSWGKVLRTRKRNIQAADMKNRKGQRLKSSKNSSDVTDPALTSLKVLDQCQGLTPKNERLDKPLGTATKVENSSGVLPEGMDFDANLQKSENLMESVDQQVTGQDKLDLESLEEKILDSTEGSSLERDSEFLSGSGKTRDSSQCSEDTASSEMVSLKDNGSLPQATAAAGTPKKSLRLRSGNRGFPSKFSDSFIYGIKISTSPTSSAKKSMTPKSVMKTSPPQPQKSKLQVPKDSPVVNEELDHLGPSSTKENLGNEQPDESQIEAKHSTAQNSVCHEQVESTVIQPIVDDTVAVENEPGNVLAEKGTPSSASNESSSNGLLNSGVQTNTLENVNEVVITKDDEVDKTESTTTKLVTDEDNVAVDDKMVTQDSEQLINIPITSTTTNDSAKSDTNEVMPFKDSSASTKSVTETVVALVAATPSTKPPAPTCDTPDNLTPRSYSPSPVYSPTTGILKKRIVNGNGDTPSPPNKQRRVSFADPIFEEKTLPSPVSQKRRLTPCSSRSSRRSLLINYKKRDSNSQSNSPNGSQSSYSSSQESQLNCTDPIFPDLVNCSEPVGQILPQLTSSIWSRGLGQLLRAKKIHTIGDLASLSEYEIHNLPVRSPKVSNVKTVLANFKQQQDAKREKSANTSITEIMAAAMSARSSSSSTLTSFLSSSSSSNESDVQSLNKNENKTNANLKIPAVASETLESKTPEKKTESASLTATTSDLLIDKNRPNEDLEEMSELDLTSSFLKSDVENSALQPENLIASKSDSGTTLPVSNEDMALPLSSENGVLPISSEETALPIPSESTTMPESNIGTALPESNIGTALPESNIGTALPESNIGTALPESNIGTALPESTDCTILSESTGGGTLPDSGEGTSLPDTDEGTALPDTDEGTTLPDNDMSTSFPVTDKGTTLPDSGEGTSLPDSNEGTALRDSGEGTSLPDSNDTNSLPNSNVLLNICAATAINCNNNATTTVQDSTVVPTNGDNDFNARDIPTSINLFDKPEASSTPVKVPEEKETDHKTKEESIHLVLENSKSADSPCSIKPICLEMKFSALDPDMEDIDEGDEYCTVDDDVKSLLKNSSVLLEEVEKLSQSVQELERSPRSPKTLRRQKYQEPEGSPEPESTEGFDIEHLLPKMAEQNAEKTGPSPVHSAVQKDLELLPTLKDLSTKFTEKEIQELNGEDIQDVHECLQRLFRSVMRAVIPGTKTNK